MGAIAIQCLTVFLLTGIKVISIAFFVFALGIFAIDLAMVFPKIVHLYALFVPEMEVWLSGGDPSYVYSPIFYLFFIIPLSASMGALSFLIFYLAWYLWKIKTPPFV